MRLLLLLFVLVPLLELYLLTVLSRHIGLGLTFAITLLTGIAGSALAKREGLRAFREWRSSLNALQAPEIGLVEGLLILVGGALLITPGVLTDVTGLGLLLPWTRRPLARWIKGRVALYLERHTVVAYSPGPPGAYRSGRVVDTTAEPVEEPAREPRILESRDETPGSSAPDKG